MTSFFQEGPDKYFHQSRLDCILVLVSRALSIYRKDDTSPKGKESQGTTSWKLGWLTVSAVANSGWYYKTFSISRVRVLVAWYRVTIGWEAVSLTVLDTDQKSWIVPKSYSEVCIESMDPDKYFHQSRPNCILVLVSRVLLTYRKDDTSLKGQESRGTTSWELGWLTYSAVADSGWYYKTFSTCRVRVLIAWY